MASGENFYIDNCSKKIILNINLYPHNELEHVQRTTNKLS